MCIGRTARNLVEWAAGISTGSAQEMQKGGSSVLSSQFSVLSSQFSVSSSQLGGWLWSGRLLRQF